MAATAAVGDARECVTGAAAGGECAGAPALSSLPRAEPAAIVGEEEDVGACAALLADCGGASSDSAAVTLGVSTPASGAGAGEDGGDGDNSSTVGSPCGVGTARWARLRVADAEPVGARARAAVPARSCPAQRSESALCATL